MGKEPIIREEIPFKYQWDLTSYYVNKEAWMKDLDFVKEKMNLFTKYQGHLLENAHILYQALLDYYEIDQKLERVYAYSTFQHDVELSNSEYEEMLTMALDVVSNASISSTFFIPELLEGTWDTIVTYFKEEPKLETYHFVLEKIYRQKEHTLTKPEEHILSSFATLDHTFEELEEVLYHSDLNYGTVTDEKGNSYPLASSNYMTLMDSNNREFRKQVYETYHSKIKEVHHTIGINYLGHLRYMTTIAKMRNYPSTLAMQLEQNDIPVSIYDHLIEVVNSHLSSYQRYFHLYRKKMGYEKLYSWDLVHDYLPGSERTYSVEEAKTLILESLQILGTDYQNILKEGFQNKWIDLYPCISKQSGFYSGGSYQANPVILANYDGKLDDVSALAHELGHSVHTYLCSYHNPYHDYDYCHFVAEVASLTNELLFCYYMLEHSTSVSEKQMVLINMIRLFNGNLFDSTLGAEFELFGHTKIENEEAVTATTLSEYYQHLQHKYYGDAVEVSELSSYRWANIPHFYTDYYYFQYATSLSAAAQVVANIRSRGREAVEEYLSFLKAGGSMDPVILLKNMKIDMENTDVFENAILLYNQLLDEFEKLN